MKEYKDLLLTRWIFREPHLFVTRLLFSMLSRFLPLSLLASPALTHEIVWKPSCPPEITSLNSSLPIVCGSLQVPLDYTNVSSTKTLDLHLYKIAVANGTKSKHSVLLNFGGPGNDGLNNFSMNSSALQL